MTGLDVEGIDWADLRALRSAYLDGSAGDGAYWSSDALLSAYDRTFGERIGWKWDFVLAELAQREWEPPRGLVLDWGCGTGVAGRRFLGQFPDSGPLVCSDRSARAERFARQAAEDAGLALGAGDEAATVLVSHVLSELDPPTLDDVLDTVGRATALVWVEPGDRDNARRLQSIRERLIGEFAAVAPCTHQAPCPLEAEGMDRHWCHHFAPAPAEAFTDPGWGRFVSETGIDLRSTPVSFLVMDRRGVTTDHADAVHVIGRPRVSKVEAKVFGCDERGATDARLSKRRLPGEYRAAKKGKLDPLARWRVDHDQIVSWEPWRPAGPT